MNAVASNPLRMGVLGCANIARQFVRDLAPSTTVQVVAVASREAAKAAEFAHSFGLARAHGSYEALLADADVQAIYLPLPNHLHAPWAIKAAQAGKHVLCEKPLALGRAEAQAMFAAARAHHVMLLEAYPYAFQPQTQALRRLIEDGTLGPLRSMQASFGFTLAKPEGNIRFNPDMGGGALLDGGSYPVSLIRLAMGSAPHKVQGHARWHESGVDIAFHGTLWWADGRYAQFSCAMDAANHRHATLVGTQGTLETEYLNHVHEGAAGNHPYGHQPSQMRLRRGVANTVPFEPVVCAGGSGFRHAAETFARWVAQGDHAVCAGFEHASLDIAATLEALARSARSGQVETLPA
jgi:predicted dehydrogenase